MKCDFSVASSSFGDSEARQIEGQTGHKGKIRRHDYVSVSNCAMVKISCKGRRDRREENDPNVYGAEGKISWLKTPLTKPPKSSLSTKRKQQKTFGRTRRTTLCPYKNTANIKNKQQLLSQLGNERNKYQFLYDLRRFHLMAQLLRGVRFSRVEDSTQRRVTRK